MRDSAPTLRGGTSRLNDAVKLDAGVRSTGMARVQYVKNATAKAATQTTMRCDFITVVYEVYLKHHLRQGAPNEEHREAPLTYAIA